MVQHKGTRTRQSKVETQSQDKDNSFNTPFHISQKGMGAVCSHGESMLDRDSH